MGYSGTILFPGHHMGKYNIIIPLILEYYVLSAYVRSHCIYSLPLVHR